MKLLLCSIVHANKGLPGTPRIGKNMQISGHNLCNIPTAGGHWNNLTDNRSNILHMNTGRKLQTSTNIVKKLFNSGITGKNETGMSVNVVTNPRKSTRGLPIRLFVINLKSATGKIWTNQWTVQLGNLERWTSANPIIKKYADRDALRPMCLQRLKQLSKNIRSAGKPKRQNSKLEKSRTAPNKLPRESQIFAMIRKNVTWW